MLQNDALWLDPTQLALLGSRIVDPSVTSGSRYYAAKQGETRLICCSDCQQIWQTAIIGA